MAAVGSHLRRYLPIRARMADIAQASLASKSF
jgi:hypothetical protein